MKRTLSALPPVVADSPAGDAPMPAGAFFLADEDRARLERIERQLAMLLERLGVMQPGRDEYDAAIAALARGNRAPLEQYLARGGKIQEG